MSELSGSAATASGTPGGDAEPEDDLLDDEPAAADGGADLPADGILHPFKDRSLGWTLLVFGVVAFFFAGRLTIDDWKLAVDPSFVPSCSYNVFITCTAAMQSWQGKLLGFPNPFLGVAAFAILVTSAVAILAGFRPPRWYRACLLFFSTAGLGLIVFLVWTSLYALARLCPFCVAVWACMLPIWWYQVVGAVQTRLLPLPGRARAFVVRNRLVGVVVLYLALALWIFGVLHEPLLEYVF